ncbi:pyruvate kinase [Candidatus Velamenicoccus archaeovorus]|uniref:Pyruvate kinase n=1 Tax=Velamenicoccus archaeovorus TaxID=1930593 RepID=A0A410P2S9_VELA1|nr:pyruvate kinase [Candidatus Velamenicoccus archaeovorus]QAT16443.1 pyruvate kinase [Candidatus Velamenicoccus archaeovorus]
MVKTKIIATIGPASRSSAVLRRMMRAGLDVVRLNFSHATHAECLQTIRMVRQLNRRYGRSLRLLGDLEGHRVRIGRLRDHQSLTLRKGQTLWLVQDAGFVGEGNRVAFDYEGAIKDIHQGHRIFVDDGLIALDVLSVSRRVLKTRVVFDGVLGEFKGVNIPQARLHFGGLSSKDKEDIAFGCVHSLDFLAQSFVRTASDMLAVRRVLPVGRKGKVRLVAKIENADGIRNIDRIIDASDAVMVARGDMGVSIPIEDVPVVQKEIIRKCNARKKPVITATQMLEHMTVERIPTRAEVSDVANAVLDGSDYVMLSAETAAGRYPVEAVAMMNKIIRVTEEWCRCRGR